VEQDGGWVAEPGGTGDRYILDLRHGDAPAAVPKTHGQPRRTAIAVLVIVIVLTAGLGAEVALALLGAPSRTPPGPGQVVLRSMEAAERARSFSYVSTWRTGAWSLHVSGDIAGSSGAQQVTVGGAHYGAVLVGGVVYFRGDASALEDQLQFPSKLASEVAGSWISLQSSDAPYAQLAESLTSVSALNQVLIDAKRTSTRGDTRGGPVARVTGIIPVGSARLDVATRSGFPTAYEARGQDGTRPWESAITFSRWNTPIRLQAPRGARAYAALQDAR